MRFNLLFLLSMLTACTSSYVGFETSELCISPSEARSLSLEHQGKTIQVCGYFVSNFENINIYDTKKDSKKYSATKCLSVAGGEDLSLSSFSEQYIQAIGLFTLNFCPEDAICMGSCSSSGVYLKQLSKLE